MAAKIEISSTSHALKSSDLILTFLYYKNHSLLGIKGLLQNEQLN